MARVILDKVPVSWVDVPVERIKLVAQRCNARCQQPVSLDDDQCRFGKVLRAHVAGVGDLEGLRTVLKGLCIGHAGLEIEHGRAHVHEEDVEVALAHRNHLLT
eukprot:CAMPEP_0185210228 /NCGR_PEP_ID=MMETSP1140-20130426/65207_1 /TAXON_ID=298111 /ORGANISM="Pavlova sp., Strain CCMP459" /LENGTH=102 /DNA_ID=CAMNT_0027778027 /DNA_START=359 /DNA_END=663 /DNA_ORIENTATION=-